MKSRFNTYDVVCMVTELQRLIGMRVSNVYDIDNKNYLIRLQRSEEKAVLLLESGIRFHTTRFEWPKNVAPSGFSMKMRKHLKNKRLEELYQLGTDRIVIMRFGSGEAAYHVILELYDRGNILLTDHQMVILNILRPHTEGEKVRFANREKYPADRAKQFDAITEAVVKDIIAKAKDGEGLRKHLVTHFEFGPALIDHVLRKVGFAESCKINVDFNAADETQLGQLMDALNLAERLLALAKKEISKGYIVQKKEIKPATDASVEPDFIMRNQEFHPMLFQQNIDRPYAEFDSFDVAVDEYYSTFESQRIDMKTLQQEREALKKLENVRKDHTERVQTLEKTQEIDKQKAELITRNQTVVDAAILSVRHILASQVSWSELENLIKEAKSNGDPIAQLIKQLKLETNHITLLLSDPYVNENSDDEQQPELQSQLVDIDLGLSAFANATRYYDQKRIAAKKAQKTIESHGKALKSAERKTKQTLKDVQNMSNITKARKVFWFEKFFWFISSENYLIIGGRDQQQNELIVKRYMRATDVYVHADIHGASSVVVKNPNPEMPVPPKTLNEAGIMAICYSIAWEAKVVTSAWWVAGSQVSKTAPTGEYLTTGSFMIRGKKNFLPPCQLAMGFSFLFKLEDGSIERHKNERCVRSLDDEADKYFGKDNEENEEIVLSSDDDENDDDKKLEVIEERGQNGEEEEGQVDFPDTEVKINFNNITLKNDNKAKFETKSEQIETVVYLGDDKPIVVKPRTNSHRSTSSSVKFEDEKSSNKNEKPNNQPQLKRGQRSKLKKIKEKYKDQDEEERQLRMQILQSAGSAKDSRKSKKQQKDVANTERNKQNKERSMNNMRANQMKKELGNDKNEEEDAEEKEEATVGVDVDTLNSLTGIPVGEDELLFAVPVVAPYSTLANYKFKVKLTPGTGKRGKAAKMAVSMFLKDKLISPREKDLLKGVKEETMVRNLPGKVKLSAPKLQNRRR